MVMGVGGGHTTVSSVQRRGRLHPDRMAGVYAPPIWGVKPAGSPTRARSHAPDIATALGEALGVNPRFWTNLEADYQTTLVRIHSRKMLPAEPGQ